MAESHVVSGLVTKRSELSGLVAHHRKEIDRLTLEVMVLDTVIKLFSPDYRIQTIKAKRFQRKNSFFKSGEANRVILGVLRDTEKPMSTHDIAMSIMTLKQIDPECEKPLQATILTTLHNQKKKGLVDMTGKDRAGSCLWILI